MSFFASLSGVRVVSGGVRFPWSGTWLADVWLDADAAPTGAAEVVIGGWRGQGTIATAFSGAFQGRTWVRVLGGAGRWGEAVKARHYHSDAGVKPATVIADLARDVGERLGSVAVEARLGADFVRPAGPASRALVRAIGGKASGAAWWVDSEGRTQVGARPRVEVTGDHEVLEHDPRAHVATLALDDPRVVGVGSILRARLSRPMLVRELELAIDGGSVRVRAWGADA